MTVSGAWPDWDQDGANWPHREASRFVSAGNFDWHVQLMGPETAPPLLLLHGTGAASHSWRNVMPDLAAHWRVITPDLPCHGFTRPHRSADLSLAGMTVALLDLLKALDLVPRHVAGHSAGGAIAVNLAHAARRKLRTKTGYREVTAINGAFLPIRGNRVLSPMAKALFANPFSAGMFAILAKNTPLGGNLIEATGSRIDAEGRALYRMLMASPGHVRGALGMMAAWDLSDFGAMLKGLDIPLTLIAARDDRMVPFANSEHAAALAPKSHLIASDTGGHLLHETDGERVAGWIAGACASMKPQGETAA